MIVRGRMWSETEPTQPILTMIGLDWHDANKITQRCLGNVRSMLPYQPDRRCTKKSKIRSAHPHLPHVPLRKVKHLFKSQDNL